MIVERRHPMTGEMERRDLTMTPEQWDQWQSGGLLDRVAPEMPIEERAWLLYGSLDLAPEDWDGKEFATDRDTLV